MALEWHLRGKFEWILRRTASWFAEDAFPVNRETVGLCDIPERNKLIKSPSAKFRGRGGREREREDSARGRLCSWRILATPIFTLESIGRKLNSPNSIANTETREGRRAHNLAPVNYIVFPAKGNKKTSFPLPDRCGEFSRSFFRRLCKCRKDRAGFEVIPVHASSVDELRSRERTRNRLIAGTSSDLR